MMHIIIFADLHIGHRIITRNDPGLTFLLEDAGSFPTPPMNHHNFKLSDNRAVHATRTSCEQSERRADSRL